MESTNKQFVSGQICYNLDTYFLSNGKSHIFENFKRITPTEYFNYIKHSFVVNFFDHFSTKFFEIIIKYSSIFNSTYWKILQKNSPNLILRHIKEIVLINFFDYSVGIYLNNILYISFLNTVFTKIFNIFSNLIF